MNTPQSQTPATNTPSVSTPDQPPTYNSQQAQRWEMSPEAVSASIRYPRFMLPRLV